MSVSESIRALGASSKAKLPGRIGFGLILRIMAVFLVVGFAGSTVHAISVGYASDDSGLVVGMAVAIIGDQDNSGSSKLVRASMNDQDKVIGIAVDVTNSLVATGDKADSVYVETQGNVTALVADAGGNVSPGDPLGVSALDGVLMKVGEGQGVVAVAQSAFISEGASRYYTSERDKIGVLVGSVVVNLDVTSGRGYGQQAKKMDFLSLPDHLLGRKLVLLEFGWLSSFSSWLC